MVTTVRMHRRTDDSGNQDVFASAFLLLGFLCVDFLWVGCFPDISAHAVLRRPSHVHLRECRAQVPYTYQKCQIRQSARNVGFKQIRTLDTLGETLQNN